MTLDPGVKKFGHAHFRFVRQRSPKIVKFLEFSKFSGGQSTRVTSYGTHTRSLRVPWGTTYIFWKKSYFPETFWGRVEKKNFKKFSGGTLTSHAHHIWHSGRGSRPLWACQISSPAHFRFPRYRPRKSDFFRGHFEVTWGVPRPINFVPYPYTPPAVQF